MTVTQTQDICQQINSFTDVLYLSGDSSIDGPIRKFLKAKKLSYAAVSIDDFAHLRHKLDLIGTTIIDLQGLTLQQQQMLSRIIEALEMKHVGSILLNGRASGKIKSFSLARSSVKSFSLSDPMDTVSLEELWMRISVNLAFRKRSSGIVVKPAIPPNQLPGTANSMAQQLKITESLVDNLSQQLRLAGLVQRDFLPGQLPECGRVEWAATFLPAEWVSGDIYDVARIDEDHIGFYVADAVGHSMPAALLTIFLKQSLRMRETIGSNYHIFSPKEVMTRLNSKMSAQKLSGYQFATCCYCLLNIKTLQMTFARAGHPYPILIRPGCKPQHLESRGSLLGIFEQAHFTETTVQLAPGDRVLLYSDGAEPFIGSFHDGQGFKWTDKFLEISHMGINEMTDHFNSRVQNTETDAAEVDDVTLVGLQITQ